METIVLGIHIFACVALILIVLLQASKGGGFSGIFGGASSNEALFGGPSGNTLIKKITVGLAIVFMLTSLSLTIFKSRGPSRSVFERAPTGPSP